MNKVSTKIELQFDLENSELLSDEQKDILRNKLANRISNKGILLLSCDDTRSQHKNKEIAGKRFVRLIKDALRKPKKRKPTSVPHKVKVKRLNSKKQHSEKKKQRKKPDLES